MLDQTPWIEKQEEDKQASVVETKIIVSAFDIIKSKEEAFEIDAENLMQMELPEVKLSREVPRNPSAETMQIKR